MTVDELHTKMEAEFKAVRAEIKADGDATRLHFDVVAEQFKEYTNVLADGSARNTERLDDHEKRIKVLERRSS
jgi:hypothetical protein